MEKGNDDGDFIPPHLMQTMTDRGTWGILIKWDRKRSQTSLQGTPDRSAILPPRYPSGCCTGVACFCSCDHIQLLPQSRHALTTVQLSASHTHMPFPGKAASRVPSPKSQIPVSSIRLDTFTADGSN